MGVLGTAGHVDHGKSSLVLALTGIDPDRLREEKEREMTIDLGFAWLDLPDGQRVGIVDVPGHKDFIKNMLAGVGGIDAALLVIAADEGPMPQTREHLDILDLLQVKAGIVALTKIDLVDDPEWLELVEAEIVELLAGTSLEGAPIVRVSSRTGEGLDRLKEEISRLMKSVGAREGKGRGRLPVDRAFTIAGFGTVVTGTLLDGPFRIGDEVEIQPKGLRARIRGLQSHKQKLEVAQPGSRVAVNLSGVDLESVARGDVVAVPGTLRPTTMIDASLRYLADAPVPLRHNTLVDFFSGAAEVQALVRLLDKEQVTPGETCWVQLRLMEPVAVLKGDRFIIRLPSPSVTIGGGVIVDPHPRRRHRRFRPEVIRHLETLAFGTPAELLLQSLRTIEPCTVAELKAKSQMADDVFAQALQECLEQKDVVLLTAGEGSAGAPRAEPSAVIMSFAGWQNLRDQIAQLLSDYHRSFPLRRGIPKEELKSRLRLNSKTFNAVLQYAGAQGVVTESDGTVSLPAHRVQFSPEQQAKVEEVLAAFRAQPYTPPSIPELERQLGTELLNACFEQNILVKLNEEVAFLPETFEHMRQAVVEFIQRNGSITVAQARDLFNTSRRYALALMGYLDMIGLTRRVGDERVLR